MTLAETLEPVPLPYGDWRALRTAAQTLIDALQEKAYATRHQDFEYEASVKLGGKRQCADWDLVGELVKAAHPALAGPPDLETELKERWGERWLQEAWQRWVDDAQEDLLKNWLPGEVHAKPQHYDWLLQRAQKGEPTGYPDVDHLPNLEGKRALLETKKRNDQTWLEALALVDRKSAGFYGAQGGHFCFNRNWGYGDLESLLDALEPLSPDAWDALAQGRYLCPDGEPIEGLEACLDVPPYEDALAAFRDAERKHQLCQGVCNQIEAPAKGMDFHAELKYRLENDPDLKDWVEELKELSHANAEGGNYFARLARHHDAPVTLADGLALGYCETGIRNWARRAFPGRESVTVGELYRKVTDPKCPQRGLAMRVLRHKFHRLDHAAA